MRKPLIQLFTLIALCALITLPNLADQGLTNSEAHRVIPAIEMVDSGNYLVPHMFSQPYLRKPQLVPWLFAAALKLHNNPTLTPRLVSATAFTLMVLGSWFFTRRWFGPPAALPAAIALALTPLYWSPARAAEIESIHNLTTAIGAWIVIELLIRKPKSANTHSWSLALAAISLAMILEKGPAGFPIFLGILSAAAILSRSIKPILNPTIIIPVALAASIFAWHWGRTLSAAGPDAIVQSPNAFMFETDKLLKLAGFVPTSLLTALPLTLATLFPWGKDARSEAQSNPDSPQQTTHQLHTARLIALSVPLALLIMNITGVSNDRYAQPILAPLAPLVGWLLITNLNPQRKKILHTLTLGSPKALAALLCLLAIIYITTIEPKTRSTSGKQPATKLAEQLTKNLPPARYTLIADAMIEARPETLLYLKSALRETDYQLDIRWIPKLQTEHITNLPQQSHAKLLALLRTDQKGNESDKLLIESVLARSTVHEFELALVVLRQPLNQDHSKMQHLQGISP